MCTFKSTLILLAHSEICWRSCTCFVVHICQHRGQPTCNIGCMELLILQCLLLILLFEILFTCPACHFRSTRLEISHLGIRDSMVCNVQSHILARSLLVNLVLQIDLTLPCLQSPDPCFLPSRFLVLLRHR